MKKVVVICGPTAVGKTDLSVMLAQTFKAEIISGDSVQVYQGMDIGSAKITASEKKGVKHHLIDIMAPNDAFDVATFQKLVREKIQQIDIPFIVGGTGLYIKAALFDYEFDSPKRNFEVEANYDHLDNQALYARLIEKDIASTKLIHPNNRRRVLRALEIADGKKRSNLDKKDVPLYDALVLYLTMDREKLYDRINQRVDSMMTQGLLEEVRTLKTKGVTPNILGYRELNQYLDGIIPLDDAIQLIKQKTRHLAKRQETWFKHQMQSHIISVSDQETTYKTMASIISAFLEVK
ncbi:MAG: tRNA (adenosine(37)-N6)-dimethylallyltransferase MiaA [Tenericutes bacterium HGW-Tenericutes-8]|nr:MAG: tRNA (adenosine(37)-N6)-dimethylallyltransferase MiaA [Tenericutes bacterium HGW-Tenericutes-8]